MSVSIVDHILLEVFVVAQFLTHWILLEASGLDLSSHLLYGGI